MIIPTQIAKSASGATIKLRCNTSCKTTNIVCLITCTKCGKKYVGETGDHVNQRMNGHRDDWKYKRFERSPVAEHFCLPEHDFLNHATLCCLDHNPEWTDRTRKARELLDPTSEHSTTIWDHQGRTVEGIIVPMSGHATAYVERFVCVILRRLGPFALRTGKKTLRLVYILFGVRFMCIVYIAYMATVVLIVKISFIRFAHCVDSEDKLYTFCTLCFRVLFTFHIYLNTISYQVAAD